MKILFCEKSGTYFALGKSENRFGQEVRYSGCGNTRQSAINDCIVKFNKLGETK